MRLFPCTSGQESAASPQLSQGEVSRKRTTSQFCTLRLPERRSPLDSGRGHLPRPPPPRGAHQGRADLPRSGKRIWPQPAPPGPTPRDTTPRLRTEPTGFRAPGNGSRGSAPEPPPTSQPRLPATWRGGLTGSGGSLTVRPPASPRGHLILGRRGKALRAPASGRLTGRPNTSQEAEQRAGRPGAGM